MLGLFPRRGRAVSSGDYNELGKVTQGTRKTHCLEEERGDRQRPWLRVPARLSG